VAGRGKRSIGSPAAALQSHLRDVVSAAAQVTHRAKDKSLDVQLSKLTLFGYDARRDTPQSLELEPGFFGQFANGKDKPVKVVTLDMMIHFACAGGNNGRGERLNGYRTLLPIEARSVEHPRSVSPVSGPQQPLVAEAQLLPADAQSKAWSATQLQPCEPQVPLVFEWGQRGEPGVGADSCILALNRYGEPVDRLHRQIQAQPRQQIEVVSFRNKANSGIALPSASIFPLEPNPGW
jgi:hypothetical protein